MKLVPGTKATYRIKGFGPKAGEVIEFTCMGCDSLKAQVEKLRRQRANWRGLVIDLVNQFALETDKGLFTSGLRDLEDAFSALELEEGCSRQDLWNKRKE